MSDEIYSTAYDPNPSHPTTGGKDDSMAFPSSPASKSAGDAVVGSGAYDPGQGSSGATPDGLCGRTTEKVDYTVPGQGEIYSPGGLIGQTPKS